MNAPTQAIWQGHPTVWPEAEVIGQPVKGQQDPLLLVRRRQSGLVGANGEEVVYLEGFPAISLFTGAGGMDIGLESAGWVTVCQHEWNHEACQTLIANRPRCFRHAALIQGDIFKTPSSMLLREAGLRVGECYVVCGGPPCQGFSTSNRKAGEGQYDHRNDLVFQYLRVINDTKPRFFIMENVPGFVSFNQGEYFKAFLQTAYDCYYDLVYGLVDAADYQVPQRRIRFICMGTRRDVSEIDGQIASLPAPVCFGNRDLKIIRAGGDEAERRKRPPGIRYFPDRPILTPPSPRPLGDREEDLNQGRPEHYLKFYDQLKRDEPDRLVA